MMADVLISSLLRSSEQSRADMEKTIRDQTEELTTLRANSFILETLEIEVRGLRDYKYKFQEQCKTIDGFKKQDQSFRQQIVQLEAERDEAMNDRASKIKILELLKKLTLSQDMVMEKEEIIAKTENTMTMLFEKCNHLGMSNKDIKEELKRCLESEQNLMEFSKKIQSCKNYLEKETEQLNRELEFERSSKEEMSLELGSLRTEVENYENRLAESENKLVFANEELQSARQLLGDYETGELKTAAWINELESKEGELKACKDSYEERLEQLRNEIDAKKSENHRMEVLQEKVRSDYQEMDSKLRHYEDDYVSSEGVERIKNELQLKYKLEMNKELQRVSAAFEKEQDDLLQTMRASLTLKSKDFKKMS